MNNNELLELYQEAYKQGFVYDIEKPNGCVSDGCTDCPAVPACRQLSEYPHSEYETFVKNYKALREYAHKI